MSDNRDVKRGGGDPPAAAAAAAPVAAAAPADAGAAAAPAAAAAPPIPSATTPHDGGAPNKRIIGMTVPPTPKRATRASTGAPIALTAKGSLYKARKDTGDSLISFLFAPSRAVSPAGPGLGMARLYIFFKL